MPVPVGILSYLTEITPPTGGTITTSADGYRTHTFLTDGVFDPRDLAGQSFEHLVVGGAGAGGGGQPSVTYGGGASGGQVVFGTATFSVPQAVVIGAGGTPPGTHAAPPANKGANGSPSSLGSITALGGEGGDQDGSGEGGDNAAFNGASRTGVSGGGGAGAGGVGIAGNGSTGGTGGPGVEWPPLSGNRYGGGGAGGGNAGGVAGSGGGGAAGQNGVPNTGGGAGGLSGGVTDTGRVGGSGIVIVRYLYPPFPILGGIVTMPGDGYRYHKYVASGDVVVNSVLNVEALIIGGAGGGGYDVAAGGGAGGWRTATFTALAPGTYPVVIGPGGVGGTSAVAPTNGGNTTFNGVTALGGGYGGGTVTGDATKGNGGNGASGGGGKGGGAPNNLGGLGTAGQGNNGGLGEPDWSPTTPGGGGGGGAGGVGTAGTESVAGDGGPGLQWLDGNYYAGGGGAGRYITGSGPGGLGGIGGGGRGGTRSAGATAPTAGTPNTGGGGGGGGASDAGGDPNGKAGGSGVVILRYPITVSYQTLLLQQGHTSYWACQTARATSAIEPDLIGTRPMTLARGSVPALAAGQGPLGGTDKGITFVAADIEQLETGTAVNTLQKWSWSGWFRGPAATGNGPVLLYLKTGTNSYIMLLHRDDKGGICLQIDSGVGAVFLDPGTYQVGTNVWRHIVLTRDYSTTNTLDVWRLYLDGVQIGTGTAATIGFTATGTGATSSMAFAGRWDTSIAANQWEGDVAHIALALGVTLTPAQVAAQYAARLA